MKKRYFVVIILGLLLIVGISFFSYLLAKEEKAATSGKPLFVVAGAEPGTSLFPANERMRRLHKRIDIEQEAWALVKWHLYDQAIAKYQEAMRPEYLNQEDDKAGAMYGIGEVHKIQGKYEEALKDLEWFIERSKSRMKPGETPGWLDEKLELQALIAYRDTGSPQLIHEHIQYLREKYKEVLPPKQYNGIVISTILRLYDHIGDYDSGIALIDEILSTIFPSEPNDQRERTCHLALRRLFEEEKRDGTRGKVTQAIVESDYFPY